MAPHNLFRLPTDVAISPAAPVSTAYGEHAIRYANNIRVEQDEDIPKTTYETLTDELVRTIYSHGQVKMDILNISRLTIAVLSSQQQQKIRITLE